MKLFDTLKNIWKIEELKTRILTTLGLILVYRLGTEIVLPGIDPHGLQALKDQTSSGVLGLLDMFSGGAFSNASVFALGIMPYISASIVVQLLGIAVPYFQRLQKEGERQADHNQLGSDLLGHFAHPCRHLVAGFQGDLRGDGRCKELGAVTGGKAGAAVAVVNS